MLPYFLCSLKLAHSCEISNSCGVRGHLQLPVEHRIHDLLSKKLERKNNFPKHMVRLLMGLDSWGFHLRFSETTYLLQLAERLQFCRFPDDPAPFSYCKSQKKKKNLFFQCRFWYFCVFINQNGWVLSCSCIYLSHLNYITSIPYKHICL